MSRINCLCTSIQRNCNLIKNLEIQVDKLLKNAKEKSIIYSQESGNWSNNVKYEKYIEIMELYEKAIQLSNEKKEIATQGCALLDREIQDLDMELKKIGDAMLGGDGLCNADGSGISGIEADGAKALTKKNAKTSSDQKAGKSSVGGHLPKSTDIDPNEPLYCFCQQVSYGDMIGCDDPDCELEWFHFECVGLQDKPKGRWYCVNCRKKKKNSGLLEEQ